MTEPRTLGRVDWMPRKKVWRVIWYKGAADIPAGDYPTKKEAEDALRELVARGNPGGETMVNPRAGTEVYVEKLPKCDFCEEPALYDAKTRMGPWAYMCEEHFKQHGLGRLGTGFGQRLRPRKALGEAEKLRGEPEKELSVTMTGDDLETATFEGVWYPTCPYCGAETPAEPDAHAVYCEACNRRFKIINPFFSSGNPGFTTEKAREIGKQLGIGFDRYDVEQFRQGLNVELEHCNVTNCDPLLTGKIAQAHLNELPDYYTRLAKMEASSVKTETERKSLHERIFGKGSTPPLERLGKGETLNNLLPMALTDGPPLPRMLALRWPWKK